MYISAVAMLLAASAALGDTRVPGSLPAAGTYELQRIMAAPEGKVLDLDGKEHAFSTYTTGKVTLLAFIYTHCADANGCPLAYAVFRILWESLNRTPGMAQKVRLVSLSFDPAHDTADVMRNYGGEYARAFKGLRWYFLTTRSVKELMPLLDGLDQDAAVAINADGSSLAMMSHLLKVFLIDPRGQVREIYTSSFLNTDVIKRDVQTLLLEKSVAGR